MTAVRRAVGWLMTGACVTATLLCGGLAQREWTLYLPIARRRLVPESGDWEGPVLGPSNRYSYRLEITGILRHRSTGYEIDAVSVLNDTASLGEHHALAVEPDGLVEPPELQAGSRHTWVPLEGVDLTGRRLAVRMDLAQWLEDSSMDGGAAGNRWEGALDAVVWQRDQLRQAATSAVLGMLGLLFGVTGAVRLRLHLRPARRRRLPFRWTEPGRLMAAIRRACAAADAALDPFTADDSGLRRRVRDLYQAAEALAEGSTALGRASHPAARRRREECLQRLHAIHAALVSLPARLALAGTVTPELASELENALEEEITAIERAAPPSQGWQRAGRGT